MASLVLVRHGQSEWNEKNLFTGWKDPDLTDKGEKEALIAGRALKASGYKFDIMFTSVLLRAKRTGSIILQQMVQEDIKIVENEALNERNYGDLQGLNKNETIKKYGEKQVQLWRRSYDDCPPGGESLKDTCDRVIPYYNKHILPVLEKGHHVLLVAHGNSLRALIKEIELLSKEQIVEVEIKTGIPILYNFDKVKKLYHKNKL